MSKLARRGFSLIEVIAAFGIALLMLGPIASMIGGIAGAFAGLDRSAQRRADLQAAGAVAMTAAPLRAGTMAIGEFEVRIQPADGDDRGALQRAGWQLYSISVRKAGGDAVLETVRIGRP